MEMTHRKGLLTFLFLLAFTSLLSMYVWKVHEVASYIERCEYAPLIWTNYHSESVWPTSGYSLFPVPHTAMDISATGGTYTCAITQLDPDDLYFYETFVKTRFLLLVLIGLVIVTISAGILEARKYKIDRKRHEIRRG
jgi:hypothetical protein